MYYDVNDESFDEEVSRLKTDLAVVNFQDEDDLNEEEQDSKQRKQVLPPKVDPWKMLSLNYDDSSDEEDKKETKKYDIKKRSLSFYKNPANLKPNNISKLDFTLSFITHAMGLKLFYSPEVTESYYKYKETELINNFGQDFKNKLDETILITIKSTIEDLFFDKNYQFYESYKLYIFKITENFLNIYQKEINDLKESILIRPQQLFRERLVSNDAFLRLNSFIKSVEAYISESLKVKDYKVTNVKTELKIIISQGSKELPKSLEKFKEHEELLERFKELAIDKSSETLQKNGCISPTNKILTNKRIKNKINKILDKSLSKFNQLLFETAKKSSTSTNINDSLGEDIINKLSYILWQETVAAEIRKNAGSIIKDNKIIPNANFINSEFKDYEDVLEYFIPITGQRIIKLIHDNFKEINIEEKFKSNFETLIKELFGSPISERTSLPNIYQNQIEDPNLIDFLSYLRLLNRSAKRIIKNNEHFGSIISGQDKAMPQKYSRGFKFNISDNFAIEEQQITCNGNRSDLVINAANYEEVSKRISNIKDNIKCSDRDIATWIRFTLEGRKPQHLIFKYENKEKKIEGYQLKELKRFLSDLTYLLFGTEAVRNPASFIHHQMAIDLILNGKMTWIDFLTSANALMPMEFEDATKAVRSLNIAYSRNMPHSYLYPKDGFSLENAKIKKLLRREADLTKKWLRDIYQIKKPKKSFEGYLNQAIDKIEKACEKWYEGISLKMEGTEISK